MTREPCSCLWAISCPATIIPRVAGAGFELRGSYQQRKLVPNSATTHSPLKDLASLSATGLNRPYQPSSLGPGRTGRTQFTRSIPASVDTIRGTDTVDSLLTHIVMQDYEGSRSIPLFLCSHFYFMNCFKDMPCIKQLNIVK